MGSLDYRSEQKKPQDLSVIAAGFPFGRAMPEAGFPPFDVSAFRLVGLEDRFGLAGDLLLSFLLQSKP